MSLQSTTDQNSYDYTDGTVTVFPYTFKIFDADDLEVVVADDSGTESTKTRGTDYTVSGVGETSGGNVTFTTAPLLASGYKLAIRRSPEFTQLTALANQGPYSATTFENALDYLTMLCQYLKNQFDRCLKVKVTSGTSGDDLIATVEDDITVELSDVLSHTHSNKGILDLLPLTVYTKTVAPGVGDDSGDNYEVGSLWYDVTNDKAYLCIDDALGAAVWKEWARDIASQAEAEAGTNTTKLMTPERTKQAIDQGIAINCVLWDSTFRVFYASTAAVTLASLDLSSAVGSSRAMVTLRIRNVSASPQALWFKPSDESASVTFITGTTTGGCAGAALAANSMAYINVATGPAAVVHWSTAAALLTEVNVISHQILQ